MRDWNTGWVHEGGGREGQMGVGYCDLLCLLHRTFISWKCVSATLRGYSKSRGVLAVSCAIYYPRGNTLVAASIHLCGGDGGWQSAERESDYGFYPWSVYLTSSPYR